MAISLPLWYEVQNVGWHCRHGSSQIFLIKALPDKISRHKLTLITQSAEM